MEGKPKFFGVEPALLRYTLGFLGVLLGLASDLRVVQEPLNLSLSIQHS